MTVQSIAIDRQHTLSGYTLDRIYATMRKRGLNAGMIEDKHPGEQRSSAAQACRYVMHVIETMEHVSCFYEIKQAYAVLYALTKLPYDYFVDDKQRNHSSSVAQAFIDVYGEVLAMLAPSDMTLVDARTLYKRLNELVQEAPIWNKEESDKYAVYSKALSFMEKGKTKKRRDTRVETETVLKFFSEQLRSHVEQLEETQRFYDSRLNWTVAIADVVLCCLPTPFSRVQDFVDWHV